MSGNFNGVSGGESGLFDLLNFLRSGRMSASEKGRELTDRAELNIKLSKMRRKHAHGSAF